MKKFIIFLMVMFASLSLTAQTVEYSEKTDNIYVGVNTGVAAWLHPHTVYHSNFVRSSHIVSGVRVGKYVTPVVGFELEGQVGTANHDTFVDHIVLGGNLMVNANNFITGYKNGEPDRVEIVPFVGIGWHHTYGTVTNNIASKFGSQVNFNMGKDKKWQINVIPSVNYIMTDNGFGKMTGQPRFDAHRGYVNVQVGVTYRFKNSNTKHYFVHHHTRCAYKYTKADYEKLLRTIDERDTLLKRAYNTNAGLTNALKEKQAEIDKLNAREMTIENVMVNSAVGFEIGKSTIHYTQKASLLNLVEMVKGTDTKLVVVGYADAKTGSKSRNLKLSEERANAVKKFLVDNGVLAENITVEFKGDTEQLYSENEVNRVVVLSK